MLLCLKALRQGFQVYFPTSLIPRSDTYERTYTHTPLIGQWLHNLGMLLPSSTTRIPKLDSLLLRFSPLFRHGQLLMCKLSTSANELRQLKDYAMSLDEEFAMWSATQPDQWRPKTVGYVVLKEYDGLLQGTTSCPSRVDTYFDGKLAQDLHRRPLI